MIFTVVKTQYLSRDRILTIRSKFKMGVSQRTELTRVEGIEILPLSRQDS